MTPREARHEIVIPARMRWETQWCAASIHNISSRGAMLRTSTPPSPGTYVEVQLSSALLVGRTVWANGRSCGIRLQDRLDLAALLGRRAGPRLVAQTAPAPALRKSSRDSAGALLARAERSRRLGAFAQFVIVVGVGACAAGSVGWEAYKVLSAPLAIVGKQP